MKPKAQIMREGRAKRAADAGKAGLVKLRIEEYVTPAQKERVLKYVARFKRGANPAISG